MFRRIAACCILLLLVLSAAGCSGAADGENLLVNGDFSAAEPLEGWNYTAWSFGEVYGTATPDEGADGSPAALLEAFEENDMRLAQEVSLQKNTNYRLSAMVRFDGGGMCNLSVLDTTLVSPYVHDTGGMWVYTELYFRTGRDLTDAAVALRIGYYGQLETGRAWFDDVRLEAVDYVPSGETVGLLRTNEPYTAPKEGEPDRTGEHAIVYSALFAIAALALYSLCARRGEPRKKVAYGMMAGILIAGAALRLYLAWTQPGYEVDVNCFGLWGQNLLSVGPLRFYDTVFCDYPPGYLYVLAAQSALTRALNFVYTDPEGLVILKMPAMICDLLTCAVLYFLAAKVLSSRKWGLLAAALYALCPAVLTDSAAWGQIDSVLTLLMVLSLALMIQRRMMPASIFFCIGVLVKPQALMFGPILLLAFLHNIHEDWRKGLKELGICFAVCAGLFALAVLPFNGLKNPVWLLEKYFSTMSSYPYASVNAMNLFGLLEGNWVEQGGMLGPLSWQAWGTIGIVASIAYAMFLYIYQQLRGCKDRRALLISALVLLAGVFTFGVRMHERYLFPTLAIALLAFLLYRDRRFLFGFAGISIGQAINLMVVLAHQHVLGEDRVFMVIGSAVHILSTLYLFYVGLSICVLGERARGSATFAPFRVPKRLVISVEQPTLERPGSRALRLARLDIILMASVTLAYAGLAFINLGDTSAPETAFRSTTTGEYVDFDLGEERDIRRFYYYGEIPEGTLEVAFAGEDGEYGPPHTVEYRNNIMFMWKILDVAEEARYARVTFLAPALRFFEFGFSGDDGVPYPAEVSDHGGMRGDYGENPAHLIDEQRFVPERPTYLNSMYFDEIYHARTAYEQVHEMPWYESTHPPLGKVFMSWCIQLLGMNPFAWRLAGTLAGILMLPGMYLLGKVLFKRTEIAFAAMMLMALDCMHLTQTRIATIDSFPVLFIIWAFFFMFLYANMSFYHEKLSRTLPPLLASGVCMGLACASKWIGLYAAAGLAVVFFYTLGRRFLEYNEARKLVAEGSGDKHMRMVAATFWKKALITCLCCVGFFIVIPLGIYVGSYYQFLMAGYGNNNLKGVWNYQTHMLSYHSGVFDTHPYSSTWYQWPVIWKPMAFFFDYRMPEGWSSSISTFGNPAVWWPGLAAIVWTIWRLIRGDSKRDPRILLVVLGFAAQYLPWVLVPRTTYIYHYFASVPFIIMAVCFFLEKLVARNRTRFVWVYLVIAAVLFAVFYPVASGLEIPIDVIKFVNWLPQWRLYWG